MSFSELETLVCDAERSGEIIGVRRSVTDDDSNEDPWTLPPSRKKKDQPIPGPLPPSAKIVRSNLVYVEKEGLPSAMLNRLHRLAAFQNPEFYRAQAMRLSTFGKPRVIRCAEEFPRHIAFPLRVFPQVHRVGRPILPTAHAATQSNPLFLQGTRIHGEKEVLVLPMDPRPPDRVSQDPGHRYRTGFPKRTRIVLVEHVEVLSRDARCLRELLPVQRQVQVGLFEQPTTEAANLGIEHNKVAAVPLAIAAF
jgi:hypothetical protein